VKNSKLNPTQNSVPAKSRGPLIALLNQALADLFTEISRKLDKSLWMLEASS
jgi:DNA-binding ferritin-like protein